MNDPTPTTALPDPDLHPLDVLAEEFAARCRSGEHPSVNEYAKRYPDLAEQIREVLPPIAMMERLKQRNLSGSAPSSLSGALSGAPLVLERLGDFRIVRELGRGGMGIVYEARQESLGRTVALKVLSRAPLLDPQRVERFEREARAAAALHHTNIVTVFGVGQTEGLHYIVMQYIRGRTLGEMIRELAGSGGGHPGEPSARSGGVAGWRSGDVATRSGQKPARSRDGAGASSIDRATPPPEHSATSSPVPTGRAYWRWVAEIGRQAADALGYAHRQGVVHRDVKPGNLLLDETSTVWITDFGLAKHAEAANVTRSGDVIGTLQYLAPEGLKAQTDARGDIYGLGATLYELLTLRPAHEASNLAALMREIAEKDPVPPSRINPHVPADLETIVMKAIARSPESRYQTGAALAEDLENFLHDRPILARRTPWVERAWRWCRRNRAVAALAALAVFAGMAAIVIGWSAYVVTNRALTNEATRRAEAEGARQRADDATLATLAAKKRADDNVALSLAGFEEIFNQLAPREDRPPPVPWRDEGPPDGPPFERGPGARPGPGGARPGPAGFDPERRPGDDARAPRPGEDGRGPGRGGGPGGGNEQEAALLKSILSFYDRFAEQNPTNDVLRAEAAKAYRRVGDSYLRISRAADADAAFRRSASIYDALLKASPDAAAYRLGLAEAVTWLASEQSPVPEADLALIHRAADLADALPSSALPNGDDVETVGRVLWRDGECLKAAGQTAAAEKRFRAAAAAWAENNRGDPRPPPDGSHRPPPPPRPSERYLAYLSLAELLTETNRAKEAAEPARAALAALEANGRGGPGGPGGGPGGGGPGGARLAPTYRRLAAVATAAGETQVAAQATSRAEMSRRVPPGGPGGQVGPGGPGGRRPPPGGPPDGR